MPSSLPGELAVTDSTGIDIYDMEGNHKGRTGVGLSGIRSITYDVENDRILLSDDTGVGQLLPDGTFDTSGFTSVPYFGIEAIDMTTDGDENPIPDMLQGEDNFKRLSPSGLDSVFNTDLGGLEIAYTQKHLIMADIGGIGVYDKLAHQDHMSYEVPEPSTLAVLGLGALGLAAGRYRRRGSTYVRRNASNRV
jgi:hypothetical protein